MEARQLLKQLKDDGWYLGDTEGACRQYIHKDRSHPVTVCVRHNDHLGTETLASIDRAGEARAGDGEVPRVAVESVEDNFSAYSPTLPGVVATGNSAEEVRERLAEAIDLHVGALRVRDGA
jgi:predicted RNA binding protein YcfA (HicA-like mRNA interferase family)